MSCNIFKVETCNAQLQSKKSFSFLNSQSQINAGDPSQFLKSSKPTITFSIPIQITYVIQYATLLLLTICMIKHYENNLCNMKLCNFLSNGNFYMTGHYAHNFGKNNLWFLSFFESYMSMCARKKIINYYHYYHYYYHYYYYYYYHYYYYYYYYYCFIIMFLNLINLCCFINLNTWSQVAYDTWQSTWRMT